MEKLEILKEQLRIDLKLLNKTLDELRESDISVAISVDYPGRNMVDTIYCHKGAATQFNIKEVYGK